MMTKILRGLLAASACVFVACGGGSGGGSNPGGDVGQVSACQTISGGSSVASLDQTNCPSCIASNTEQAVDGDTDTAASVTAPSVSAGFAGLRATAQSGVAYGGGATAAAIVARTSNAYVVVAGSLALRTYLGGTLQEEYVFSNDVIGGDVVAVGEKRQYSFKTSKAFDAVAFGVSGTAENYQADYYEFCAG